ncbi:MAG: hypothetical protein WAV78_46785 [Xanthobacteraceae bacterium]
MKLEREVRHKSEDIDDDVLLDAVQAIRRRVRVVSREYDVPYIAGYSVDGHTVFIDRHLPKSFRWLTRTVRVDPFLLTHEIVEKSAPGRVEPIRSRSAPSAMPWTSASRQWIREPERIGGMAQPLPPVRPLSEAHEP